MLLQTYDKCILFIPVEYLSYATRNLLLSNVVSCHEATFLFNNLYLNVHVGFVSTNKEKQFLMSLRGVVCSERMTSLTVWAHSQCTEI